MVQKRFVLGLVLSFLLVMSIVAAPTEEVFSSGTTPSVDDIVISTSDDIDPNSIKVATSDYGTTVVVWATEAHGGTRYSLFDEAGDALVDEGVVAACTDGDQYQPDVAMADDGRFVIVWTTDADKARGTPDTDQCVDIYAKVETKDGKQSRKEDIAIRFFNADGSPNEDIDATDKQDEQGEFVVNNHNPDSGENYDVQTCKNHFAGIDDDNKPSVAIDSDSNTVVVTWTGHEKSCSTAIARKGGLNHEGVYAKLFDLDTAGTKDISWSNYDADDNAKSYDDCTSGDDACMGATGREIPLFGDIDWTKDNTQVAVGVAEGTPFFVAAWSKDESTDDDDHFEAFVRPFRLSNGKPITSSKYYRDDSASFSDDPLFPKVGVFTGDDHDGQVVLVWTHEDRDGIRYSVYTDVKSDMQFYEATQDGVQSAKGLLSAASGTCVYVNDLVTQGDTVFVSWISVDKSEVSVPGIGTITTCTEYYSDSDKHDTTDLWSGLYELSSKDGLVAVGGSKGSVDKPRVKSYPFVTTIEDGFLYAYATASSEITLKRFDNNGEEIDYYAGEAAAEEACDTFGCDCDGNGYVDTGIGYTSALAYSRCKEEVGGTIWLEGYSCDTGPGTYYGSTAEASETDECALGEEESPGASSAEVPQCNDGEDNDGDGLVDYPEDDGCTSADDTREKSISLSLTKPGAGIGGTYGDECTDDSDCLSGICGTKDPYVGTCIQCTQDADCDSGEYCSDAYKCATESVTDYCADGIDNDGDGYTDTDDAGCDVSGVEYNSCGDSWDNDADGRTDYTGGCDEDEDGFIDRVCGCDSATKGTAGTLELPEIRAYPKKCLETDDTWGCSTSLSDWAIDSSFSCKDSGRLFPRDPECWSEGDDSERDDGEQDYYGTTTETAEPRFAPGVEGGFFARLWAFLIGA